MPTKPSLEQRVSVLEEKMEEVLAKPALRRRTEVGVCTLGVEPSSACTEGSLGKFQSGCHGDTCRLKQQEYFKEYRARKRAQKAAAETTKKVPAKRATTTTKVANPRPVKRAKAAPVPAPVAKRGVKRRRSG